MAMITPRQITRNLNGHSTEILIQTFADRILVLVTQKGKVGTLVQASIPDTTPLPPAPKSEHQLPQPPVAIQLTPLLGRAPSEHMQTLHALFTAQIATIIWMHESRGSSETARRDVVVGLALDQSGGKDGVGLTDRERDTFQGVMSMIFVVLNDSQKDQVSMD
ncbi:hypothetical protein BDZ94DRAFT_1255854 [Collybia nuda]|uniref:Proteasome assembly chaperone 3 n=1 Tax=Collybia nuda TaxID=64659 RepID=A0A9P5Y9V6_9AGAR|nr:hypothetical protein BDZ94DRAFT_1255854 [Collybia nuda]